MIIGDDRQRPCFGRDGTESATDLPGLNCGQLARRENQLRRASRRQRVADSILLAFSASSTGPDQFRFETSNRTRESAGFGNSAISGLAPAERFACARSMGAGCLTAPDNTTIPSATATRATNVKAVMLRVIANPRFDLVPIPNRRMPPFVESRNAKIMPHRIQTSDQRAAAFPLPLALQSI